MHNQQASGQQAAATAASATRDGHCLWPPPFAVVATQCSRARFKRRTACAACSFEAELIKEGSHVLMVMMPMAGGFDLNKLTTAACYDYLATASAAESSTDTDGNDCTTDDFTKSVAALVDALVYYIEEVKWMMSSHIDPEEEETKTASPNMPFDRNIYDGRAMRLFDGPACCVGEPDLLPDVRVHSRSCWMCAIAKP